MTKVTRKLNRTGGTKSLPSYGVILPKTMVTRWAVLGNMAGAPINVIVEQDRKGRIIITPSWELGSDNLLEGMDVSLLKSVEENWGEGEAISPAELED